VSSSENVGLGFGSDGEFQRQRLEVSQRTDLCTSDVPDA
jgi:hypothetical protein